MSEPTSPETSGPDAVAGPAPSAAAESADFPNGVPVGKPSGLRNPVAAVRGVGAGGLVVEAIVLLLAIQPMRVLGAHLTGLAITVIIVLAVLCVLIAGVLSRRWAWWAGLVLQGGLIACGFFHISLAILGVLFAAMWIYILSVRRSVLGR